jgi:hypothetical protein
VALKNDKFFAGLGIEEAQAKRLQVWTKQSKLSIDDGLSKVLINTWMKELHQ